LLRSDLTRHLERGLTGLVRLRALPHYDPVKYGPETWERVLYGDALQRLVYLTSYASFHSNQQQSDLSLLTLAHSLTAEMMEDELTLETLRSQRLLSPQDYRACGVIYGQWSKLMREQGRTQEMKEAAARMVAAWRQFLQLSPGDEEISRMVNSGINPYTGDRID
jgi:hypothetical protein